jgi:hypothetical protein
MDSIATGRHTAAAAASTATRNHHPNHPAAHPPGEGSTLQLPPSAIEPATATEAVAGQQHVLHPQVVGSGQQTAAVGPRLVNFALVDGREVVVMPLFNGLQPPPADGR